MYINLGKGDINGYKIIFMLWKVYEEDWRSLFWEEGIIWERGVWCREEEEEKMGLGFLICNFILMGYLLGGLFYFILLGLSVGLDDY